MFYIKLEENLDKYIEEKYSKYPEVIQKIISKIDFKNLYYKKLCDFDYIVLKNLNNKTMENLDKLINIKCLKNVCLSDNLMENNKFMQKMNDDDIKVMDGKWLLKNMVDKAIDYIAEYKNESVKIQDVAILCNKIDETIIEKIREISNKVRICNVLTNNLKQYKKLEEEMYVKNGILLNVSNNFQKNARKSSIVINFDFSINEIEECNFHKNAFIINLCRVKEFNEKSLNLRNIDSYEISFPEKYNSILENFDGFNKTYFYESLLYKNTSYKNIKKELQCDSIELEKFKDSKNKIIQNLEVNFQKRLDKIAN